MDDKSFEAYSSLPAKSAFDLRKKCDCDVLAYRKLVRIPVVVGVTYLLFVLTPLMMLLYLGALLAVTFEPLVEHLESIMKRSFAIVLVVVFFVTAFVAVLLLIGPGVASQTSALVKHAPSYLKSIQSRSPWLANFINKLPDKVRTVEPSTIAPVISELASFGGIIVATASSLVIICAFTFYFLVEGSSIYRWCTAFFDRNTRDRIEQTCHRIVPVVSGYVVGQFVTSLICSMFTLGLMSYLRIPAPLVLAITAGILDTLPVIGLILFIIPTALFALTVSIEVMCIAIVSYLAYHVLESYLLAPYIYGKRMKVSGLVVLFSLLAGGIIGGMVGAISILPLVASYPIIEEIWLERFLGRKVIIKHTGIIG